MKCRLVEERQKQSVGGECLSKKNCIPRVQKCSRERRFYPVMTLYQITYTQIRYKVF